MLLQCALECTVRRLDVSIFVRVAHVDGAWLDAIMRQQLQILCVEAPLVQLPALRIWSQFVGRRCRVVRLVDLGDIAQLH